MMIKEYTSGWDTGDDRGARECMEEILATWSRQNAAETVAVSAGVDQIDTCLRVSPAALPAWQDRLSCFAAEVKASASEAKRRSQCGRIWLLGDLAALESFFEGYAPEAEGGADRWIGFALVYQLRYGTRRFPIDLDFGIHSLTKCLATLPDAIRHYRLGMAKLALDMNVESNPENFVAARRDFLCAVSEIFEQPALAEDWEGGETCGVAPSRRAATRSRAATTLALRRLLAQLVYQPREDWVSAVGKPCAQSYGAHLYRLRASIERLCTELYSPVAA